MSGWNKILGNCFGRASVVTPAHSSRLPFCFASMFGHSASIQQIRCTLQPATHDVVPPPLRNRPVEKGLSLSSTLFGQEYLQNVTSERQSLLQEAPRQWRMLMDGLIWRKPGSFQQTGGLLPNWTTKRSRWLVDDWLLDANEDWTALLSLTDVVGIMPSAGLKIPYYHWLLSRSAFSLSQVYVL